MYKTCIFDNIEILTYRAVPNYGLGPKNPFPQKGINGDFFLVTSCTLVIQLTKFQLYTILFGVRTIFSFILLDYKTLRQQSGLLENKKKSLQCNSYFSHHLHCRKYLIVFLLYFRCLKLN